MCQLCACIIAPLTEGTSPQPVHIMKVCSVYDVCSANAASNKDNQSDMDACCMCCSTPSHGCCHTLTHKHTYQTTQSETDTDSVGHILVKKAAQLNAVTLVLSSHNKGKVAEFFVGSVVKHVTAHAHTPVTVVPAPRG